MKFVRRAIFGFVLLLPLVCVGASSGIYSQTGSFIESNLTAGSYFGLGQYRGVAVSDDGNTALVGDGYDTPNAKTYAGSIYFYSCSNGVWKQLQKIDDPDNAAADYFGYTVALSGDGKSALVESYGGDKVYLYTLSNGQWTQAHEFDDPAATPAASDLLGYGGLALSDDGKTAVITASQMTVNGNTEEGSIYIYSDASGSWTQVFSAEDPDNTAGDGFGLPAAISADGINVLVGSTATVSGNAHAGKAYLYTLSNGAWSQAHEFDDPTPAVGDYFGSSDVALSHDGSTAIMGAVGVVVNSATNAGTGYIYTKQSNSWGSPIPIADPDDVANDKFSEHLGVSSDGTRVFFGSETAVNGQASAGKAYIYALNAGSWSKLKEFDDPTAAASDLFSYAGAISGDGETFLASAIQQTVNGTPDAGEVYVYQSPVDLALTMEAGQSSVITGRQVALELTATNTDSVVTANNVVLTITLASGLSYVSSDAANGTCTHVGSTVTCKLASLVPGETWQPSVMTLASSTGTLKSHASISSNQPDPVSGNDSASASINVSTPSNSGGGGSTPPSGSGGGDVDFWTLGLLVGLLAVRTKRVKVQAMEQI